jgi:hypothetical protein
MILLIKILNISKFSANDDAIFRRILGIGKDIGLIEKTFINTVNEFGLMENGTIDRSLSREYLPQMHYRVCGMKKDYETFLKVINELQVDQHRMPDVKRHHVNITNKIKVLQKTLYNYTFFYLKCFIFL